MAYEHWKVAECINCGKRWYHYEDVEEFDCNCGEAAAEYRLIKQDAWTANDWKTLCENELENANRHSIIDIPSAMMDALQKHKFNAYILNAIMRDLAEVIWDNI